MLRELSHDEKAVESGFHALQVLQSGNEFDMAIVCIAIRKWPARSSLDDQPIVSENTDPTYDRLSRLGGRIDAAWRKKRYKIILKPYKLNELAVAVDAVAKSQVDTELSGTDARD
jgi:hypothetical protein